MPVAAAVEFVFPEAPPASPSTTTESRATDAWLARQIRGAIVHALALYDLRNRPELVEDLTQEVWCRLLERRALTRFRGGDDSIRRRYLRRIAVNVVIDDLRSNGARKRMPARLLSLDAARHELDRHFDPADCPERRLLARERLGSLIRLCREVVGNDARPEQWRVARLGLLEGRPSIEIARCLGGGWSVIAIDSYLSRLRQRLGRRGIRLAFRARGHARH